MCHMPFFKAVSADSFLMSNDGTSSNFNLKKKNTPRLLYLCDGGSVCCLLTSAALKSV